MSLKSIVRELKEMRGGGGSGGGGRTVASQVLVEEEERRRRRGKLGDGRWQGRWASLPPELLQDVMERVEVSESSWPARRQVVACAAVCQSWRYATKEVVPTPEQCGRISFPISLKQPGPRDIPIQCYVKRERATCTYQLYLGLSPALQGGNDKLLLAARRFRRAIGVDIVISLASDDFSRASANYIGKVRSNFLGTKFTVYDSQPSHNESVLSTSRSVRKMHSKKVSPRVPAGNYNIATISYELNVLRSRGPRKMQCVMHSIPFSSVQEGGSAPTPDTFVHALDGQFSSLSVGKSKEPMRNLSTKSLNDLPAPVKTSGEPLVLKNKAPRWHEQLQCWCLNFRGRVSVASVKNFQLVAAVDPPYEVPSAEQGRVILQFGKIGKDIFTMDYRYPLSTFQAFAICLSSFSTKLACTD